MISVRQIVQLVNQGEYRRLADRVLANGRLNSAALRLALDDRQAVVPCALALGLQRSCELTYGPTEETAHLSARLLRTQDRTGSGGSGAGRFAPDSPYWVITTALAVRALLDHLRQGDLSAPMRSLTFAPLPSVADVRPASTAEVHQRRVNQAVESAVKALEIVLRQNTPPPALDPATLAIVLWQLGDDPILWKRLNLDAVQRNLDGVAATMDHAGAMSRRDVDPITRFALAAA